VLHLRFENNAFRFWIGGDAFIARRATPFRRCDHGGWAVPGTDAEPDEEGLRSEMMVTEPSSERVVGDKHGVVIRGFITVVPQPYVQHLADAVFGFDPHSLVDGSIGVEGKAADDVDEKAPGAPIPMTAAKNGEVAMRPETLRPRRASRLRTMTA